MKRRLPPFAAIRAFEAAARHGSFTAAAEELNVTQSAISHQVKRLEEFLDTPLFVRAPQELTVTTAGLDYLAELTGIPALVSGGVRSLEDLSAAAKGPGIGGVIVGKALYAGTFTIEEAMAACS